MKRLITVNEDGHSIEVLVEEDAAIRVDEEHLGMQICIGPLQCVR